VRELARAFGSFLETLRLRAGCECRPADRLEAHRARPEALVDPVRRDRTDGRGAETVFDFGFVQSREAPDWLPIRFT